MKYSGSSWCCEMRICRSDIRAKIFYQQSFRLAIRAIRSMKAKKATGAPDRSKLETIVR